ncbi:BQ5605_C015g07886 [Microbotryum silenes-dioicae]|uniref:BQ5605_C015g07886 protein n=1 Tax=Microbotryum silenes-dioicae TaxID=796604 RepID=A0A2X0NXH0_9BASI|nr:BQ5605_C015g07886 [Microbotryum silenes-dioicae]
MACMVEPQRVGYDDVPLSSFASHHGEEVFFDAVVYGVEIFDIERVERPHCPLPPDRGPSSVHSLVFDRKGCGIGCRNREEVQPCVVTDESDAFAMPARLGQPIILDNPFASEIAPRIDKRG